MKYLSNYKTYKLVSESLEEVESSINQPINNTPTNEELSDLEDKSAALKIIRTITRCSNDQVNILESEESTKVIINLPTKDGNLIFVCYPSQIIRGSKDFELNDGKVEFIKTYNDINLYNADLININNPNPSNTNDLQSTTDDYGVTLQVLGKQNRDYVTGWVASVMRRFIGGDKQKNYTPLDLTELTNFIQYVFDNFG
jgi:hypothetical protein